MHFVVATFWLKGVWIVFAGGAVLREVFTGSIASQCVGGHTGKPKGVCQAAASTGAPAIHLQ